MKPYCCALAILFFGLNVAFGQSYGSGDKSYDYLTVYFVDNSDGFEAEALNDDMAGYLRESLNNLTKRPNNYFFFYGCNREESRISNNLVSFIGSPTLKKYIANPSRESDFDFDKIVIRDYFIENPIVVKQNMELNVFLSTHSIKRILKEQDQIPISVFLSNELPMYVTTLDNKNVRIRIKYYINKEAEKLFSKDEINKFISFCSSQLKTNQVTTEIEFL